MSRRSFMHATAAVAAGAALLGKFPRIPLNSPARAVTADGSSAYSMAMHIHSSFSEQDGSMDSQLFQAATNSVDVLWWTDHDHRMDGINYRDTVHFTSLTSEKGAAGQGGAWKWTKAESGPAASTSAGGIVTNPCSPNDPVKGGSMHLTAKSKTTVTAKYGYYANCQPAGWNYRDNLTGQSLTIDVMLTSGWTRGYLELLIVSSYHEATLGRPGGNYTLSYQFVPPGAAAGSVANGIQGVITVPVQPASSTNPWATITITPSNDIAALWPDLDYRDFALWELTLSAVSNGDQVGGYFDYLRFNRQISGEAFLEQQMAMEEVLAAKYPSVVQQQGLEISLSLPHINWFGGNVVIPDYGSTTAKTYGEYLLNTAIPQIHAAGGLASYNHPFGYGDPAELPQAQQDTLLAQVAANLLPTATAPAVLGADLIEVGYLLRQGVDLAHHVALWDIMSRNAVFLTGNGVSDDHVGQNWFGIHNNWVTSAWAASTGQPDLLAALAAGRAWCGSLSAFQGSLDMLVDGSVPMGAVNVSSVTSRQLAASAAGIPSGGSVQILQGAVDYAGTSGLASNTQVIASYPGTAFAGGPVTQSVDTSQDSFLRTQVLNAAGATVAVSNPVWLLQNAPPGGIPAPRQS
jgi:hypothetical protein